MYKMASIFPIFSRNYCSLLSRLVSIVNFRGMRKNIYNILRFSPVGIEAMKIQLNMLFILGLCGLFLGGCAAYIVPEIGSVASEESRIVYKGGDLQEGLLESKDLKVNYTLSGSDTETRFAGELEFDRSLTDSFPVMLRFFLKLNWLDAEGTVLQTVDVTPLFSFRNYAPNKLKIDKTIPVAPGSVAYCFNYYGVFQGEKPDVSEEWDIFLFPFTAP